MDPEEIIQEVLQGHLASSKWPAARQVKIYVSSTAEDFCEERRLLHESILPQLQSHFAPQGIEVQLVDMHQSGSDLALDAKKWSDHLYEIRECHRVSRGCFFLCLVGNKYLPCPIPDSIEAKEFQVLRKKAGTSGAIVDDWYEEDRNAPTPVFVLKQERIVHHSGQDDDGTQPESKEEPKWLKNLRQVRTLLKSTARSASEEEDDKGSKYRRYFMSAVESQFNFALGLAPGTAHRMIGVVRDLEDITEQSPGSSNYLDLPGNQGKPDPFWKERLKNFRDRICACLPNENRVYLTSPWKEGGITMGCPEQATYLHKFKDSVLTKLKELIEKGLTEDPEIKGRNKTIQEMFQETLSHSSLCQIHLKDLKGSISHEVVEKMRHLVVKPYEERHRHGPVLITGESGSGKTVLLSHVHWACEDWIGRKPLRIIRYLGTTPRSSHVVELLRVLCQHLSLLLSSDLLPKDCKFHQEYLGGWFQRLLGQVEEAEDAVLVLLLDDVHLLGRRHGDADSLLGWIPAVLPHNVHLLCTVPSDVDDALRLELKERFKDDSCVTVPPLDDPGSEAMVTCTLGALQRKLSPEQSSLVLSRCSHKPNPLYSKLLLHEASEWRSSEEAVSKVGRSVQELCDARLTRTEKRCGKKVVTKLASAISCVKFGALEMELLRLLDGDNADLCSFKRALAPFLLEHHRNGKLLLGWRHVTIAQVARRRYLTTQSEVVNAHGQIAKLLLRGFPSDEEAEEGAESEEEGDDDDAFTTADWAYTDRHVEELWYHLLQSDSFAKLKQATVCNFDFLLASVQTVSVSYTLCLLEQVRDRFLNRDLEMIYHTMTCGADVVCRDSLQLAAQVMAWLRSESEGNKTTGLLGSVIAAAMAWSDGYSEPLLVPMNAWLQPPVPQLIKTMVCPSGVKLIQLTPSGQHVVTTNTSGDPQLWHIMSGRLVHTFKGHSGPTLCLAVTRNGQYLLTGSEDISIIIWDLKTLKLKLRIYEHIAPVLCITSALGGTVVVSGGEDSRIIITSLSTGDVVMKIDHHRGPVTSVTVNQADDVLVSGSSDSTICLWSLESFNLLNTLQLSSPVVHLDISKDSVFLVALCEDNQMYLRSVATGSEIHALSGHKSKVLCVRMGEDCFRVTAGCSDSKVYVFSIHSGRATHSLPGHGAQVSGLAVAPDDDFIFSAGGSRILAWHFRQELENKTYVSNRKVIQVNHSDHVTCMDISRDGTLAVTGSRDCLLKVWQLNTPELHSTLEGHSDVVNCVAFAPNGFFAVSGSDDKTARVWGLTLGLAVSAFTHHKAPITAVAVMADSRRVVSGDSDEITMVWHADSGNVLLTCLGPSKSLHLTNNMKFALAIGSGEDDSDNSVRIWTLSRSEEKYIVSHSEPVTCLAVTGDSQYVITGSVDSSLKVWQIAGGKLAQVLVGHSKEVTAVAVSHVNMAKSTVVSASADSKLISWDIDTGNEVHVMSGHQGPVQCVRVTADGNMAISGGSDGNVLAWDLKSGLTLSAFQMHADIEGIVMSSDATRIVVRLSGSKFVPVLCVHNTPAAYVPYQPYAQPISKEPEAGGVPGKRPLRRLLKKEVSLDTYTWQKRYGHLTGAMMAATAEERRRRFSASASMEEIATLNNSKSGSGGGGGSNSNMGSQQGISNQQAASLAQSQHFENLEAMWNSKQPPRKKPVQV